MYYKQFLYVNMNLNDGNDGAVDDSDDDDDNDGGGGGGSGCLCSVQNLILINFISHVLTHTRHYFSLVLLRSLSI